MQGFKSTTSQRDMMKLATRFGPVQTICTPIGRGTNSHENYFFVKYENCTDAAEARNRTGREKVRK